MWYILRGQGTCPEEGGILMKKMFGGEMKNKVLLLLALISACTLSCSSSSPSFTQADLQDILNTELQTYSRDKIRFIRLMGTFIVEKMDMNPIVFGTDSARILQIKQCSNPAQADCYLAIRPLIIFFKIIHF